MTHIRWQNDHCSDLSELNRAEIDLYLYPAPRDEMVSPIDRGYGVPPDGAAGPSSDPNATCTPETNRTLRMAHWKRNQDVADRKKVRLDWLDSQKSREDVIWQTTLRGPNGEKLEEALERNMFPYHLPPGLEHWTLWRREEITEDWICSFIGKWLKEYRLTPCPPASIPNCYSTESGESDDNATNNNNYLLPPVVSWNFDNNNARRTIDIPHVHIYFNTCPMSVYNDARMPLSELRMGVRN